MIEAKIPKYGKWFCLIGNKFRKIEDVENLIINEDESNFYLNYEIAKGKKFFNAQTTHGGAKGYGRFCSLKLNNLQE
jgi:hypothetical protein